MESKLEKIVALAKRRGFVYPGSDIYGGLAGTWDYGPLGVALKNNIKNLWWRMFVDSRDDMYGMDAAILMNPKAWEASGHVAGFADPLGEKMFNTMFRTNVGAGEEAQTTYLRPETAGGIFVNFKNVVDSFHPKLPFGIAQIGKAFRNEIAPRDFLFRTREFEQMEIEWFTRESEWEKWFDFWRERMREWVVEIGLEKSHVHETEVPEKDRAHYSRRTIDFDYDFPFGRGELYGLAYRGDFDLSAHAKASGAELSVLDETDERVVPHVVEPSFGVDRTVLAVLDSAYAEDEMGGEKRIFLRLNPAIAPVKAAVFPLVSNKEPIVAKAREIYSSLKPLVPSIQFDDIGNIGKRYRRQDEIGTPACITVDYQTLEDDTVTVRDRDSGKQERVAAKELDIHLTIG
ncbi:MAG: glycine--tRNA ligase [Candidatus Niyogibacteria bacterium]|nr:glycine--tRNA ligase [Candidatus Niyogibacteria bacterium]